MTDEHPQKRRFPRISSEHTVLVRKLDTDTPEGFARTRVVGLGGCMFVNGYSLGAGTTIELLISVHLRVVRAVARVVYEIPKSATEVEVGVEFLEISPSDREIVETLFQPAPLP